jgi:Radical SAM superfamily/Iron-sulfur cluster-binding domain
MEPASFSEPNPRATVTLAELAAEQSTARRHLTFSMTLACPLKCAHCIVGAGPDKGSTTMPLAVARQYAAQMPDLFRYGIRMVSFTGGEPLLAKHQLRVLSTAAADAGMACGVVTAAHWATDAAAATQVIDRLPGIQTWDISVDAYHEEFLSLDRARVAYLAAKRSGKRGVLRFAYHEPLTERDRYLLAFIAEFADKADVCSQRIRSVGRASLLRIIGGGDREMTLSKPCVTKGLVIRYDGTMSPCCINLVEERGHPFQLGDARDRPLTDIHADYMAHSLLQMIRVIGFGDLLRWLAEAGIDERLLGPMPEDVCDLCPKIMTNRAWADALASRAAAPENRLRIAILASRILGENDMLHQVVRELQDQSAHIEGFEFAVTLAAETAQTMRGDRP